MNSHIGEFMTPQYETFQDNSWFGTDLWKLKFGDYVPVFQKYFQKFLKKHPKFQTVDYIGIQTFHTDRILSSSDWLEKVNADVIFGDKLENGEYITHPYFKNKENMEAVQPVCNHGIVYFKSSNPMDILSHLHSLEKIGYLSFSYFAMKYIRWYKQDNVRIMIGFIPLTM